MSRRDAGQVLAFFALVLPIVLLPVAAYAVDASMVSMRAAGLQAATAQAAETAAEQLSPAALRARGELALDAARAGVAAVATVAAEEPGATVESVAIDRVQVTVLTAELVPVPFNLFGGPVRLYARATARLVAGYDSPSSRVPLPISTF